VRGVATAFIELWRGVPLITVLFMASVMLPLFLPDGANLDKLLRAITGITLFAAAYMAEAVRGGLQAIGKGQYEGAMALGLSHWQSLRKIVLPQALRISIPNIVGIFIGLFKDTTLVLIIGIYDFLGIINAGTQDSKWAAPETSNTGYFVAALVYFAFCFAMSRYALFTERRFDTGRRA
jgi:general L-amino acid transport system permease protein